jgi:hypothetical protein
VPVQTPAWHVSLCVQALPSLHAAPSAAGGLLQVPVAGLHVPATWQESSGVHTIGEPPQVPPVQTSFVVQPCPSLQVEPSGLGGFEQMPAVHVPAV